MNIGFREIDDRNMALFKRLRLYTRFLSIAKGVIGGTPESVFEVGGMTGFFLLACQNFGIEHLAGCEMNREAVRIQRRKLGFKNVIVADFNEYAAMERSYDMIVMLDFIEHTWYPRKCLTKAFRMTTPGGVLMLKTFIEDLDVLRGREMMNPPFHSQHFFGHSLYRLLTDIGFTVKYWEISGGQVLVIAKREETLC